jgi:hypothetical protein
VNDKPRSPLSERRTTLYATQRAPPKKKWKKMKCLRGKNRGAKRG